MNKYNCLVLKNTNHKVVWNKVEFKEKEILKILQEQVNGKIESISWLFPNLYKRNIVTYINEEGKIKNLPTTLVFKTNNKYEEIKGNLCFIKLNTNGEIIGLKNKDVSEIFKTINDVRNKKWKNTIIQPKDV